MNMFKNKNKKEEKEQEMCREDASFWTKLKNEPYLRAHPTMLAISLISGAVLQYFAYLPVVLALAYIVTAVKGALEVL